MRSIRFCTPLVLVLALFAFFSAAFTQAAEKDELRARFEKRYPQILQYKTQGKVGETMQGQLEVVDPRDASNATLMNLINEENSDRKALYGLIAKEQNTTPDKVAAELAKRNYEKARPGEYLKSAEGKWEKKK